MRILRQRVEHDLEFHYLYVHPRPAHSGGYWLRLRLFLKAVNRRRLRSARIGFVAIVLGLSIIALFYAMDLVTMHVLPRFIGMDAAMSFMEDLHLNWRWSVTVLGIGSIIYGFVITFRETVTLTSELDEANRELSQREQEIRALFDNSHSLIYLKDTQSRIRRINRRYAEIYGVEEEEAVGQDGSSWLGVQNAKHLADHDRKVIESKRPTEQEFDLDDRDGNLRRMRSLKFPILDDNGNVTAIGGIGADVTDRYRTEERLKQSEAQHRICSKNRPMQSTSTSTTSSYS